MKRMPTSLIDFLTSNPSCIKADLFAVTLPTGTVMYATDGQWDITVPLGTPGWSQPLNGGTVTISGQCKPWLDLSYPFAGQTGSGLPPVSLLVTPGAPVSVQYVSGTWNDNTFRGSTDANGLHSAPVSPGGSPANLPGAQCLVTTYAMQLLGAWADATGALVAAPFPVGNSATLTPPSGAVQLLLGMNDGLFSDNFGALTLSVTGASIARPATTFKAAQYGRWTRGKIVSEAGTKVNANTMDLTCIPQPGTTYPGSALGILNAALNHLFDGATVWVFTAYMPLNQYGNVSAGIEVKWQGTVTLTSSIARNKVVFQCADPLYLLNMKVPSRLFQAACPWGFTDVNCTLTPSDYTVNFTADSSSTQTLLEPTSAFSQADGYFNQGVVTCLTGLNAGLSQTVKSHVGGQLSTVVAWLLPVAPGDTFAVIKGCDKTLSMCKTTTKANGTVIDNTVNFGGTPFVPAPQTGI